MDDKKYWEDYYTFNRDPMEASTFARFCSGFIEEDKDLIELGCGNGRDSVYFAQKGVNVLAIDQVVDELDYLNNKYADMDNICFRSADFTNLRTDATFDYVYSRFTLHAISEEGEFNVFNWIEKQLNDKGLFFLEVRSLNDPMLTKGKKISDSENVTTHYRRYLDLDETVSKLESRGLSIVYKLEDDNLSVYGDDNPVLIRIVAQKV